ncbi:MAG: inositol monophosphatase [Clostridia bacterium]|nr:inositol monophosphatase [Clostridia bacterium]
MNMQDIHALLEPVSALVRSVRPLMDDRSADRSVTVKGDSDFVTAADLAVQQALETGLRTLRPDFAFMGEESAMHTIDPAVPTWVIDPIDGTTNFIHRYAFSAISVGLVLGGEPIFGIVFNPYLDELFAAVKGFGATCNGQPISVSPLDHFDTALVGIGTMPYYKEKTSDTFRLWCSLFNAGADIRRSGSAALDVCYVAAGRMDVFAEPSLGSWDFAASSIILREAGGTLTDWHNTHLACDGHRHSVAASNGKLHQTLLDFIINADVMATTEIDD